MEIDDFLKSTNTKGFEFAEKLNCDQSYISKIKKKKVIPSLIMMMIIFKESKYKINIHDIIPEHILKKYGLESPTIKLSTSRK